MSIASLSAADLEDAIHRLVKHKNFDLRNQHLSRDQRSRLLASPPDWPHRPVFSPYAMTHHGYSQSTVLLVHSANLDHCIDCAAVGIQKTKHLVHRLIYQAYYGDLKDSLDVSHTLYLGRFTTR